MLHPCIFIGILEIDSLASPQCLTLCQPNAMIAGL